MSKHHRLAAALAAMLLAVPAARSHDDRDARIAVVLPADDREHMLEDMRDFLKRATTMLAAAAEDDLAQVAGIAAAARPPLERARSLAAGTPPPPMPAGMGGMGRGPGSERDRGRFARMQQNLPQPFRAMLLEMREGVAAAGAAATAKDGRRTLQALARVQSVCVGCHDSYRLVATDDPTTLIEARR